MATDQGPVVQSAILRGELVRLRKRSKLTQEEVARGLEWSPSKLIRIEGGHSSVTKWILMPYSRVTASPPIVTAAPPGPETGRQVGGLVELIPQ